MQVWMGKLSGTPTVGDTVFLHWVGHHGGRTSAGHVVKNGDTMEMIRDGIVESAKQYLISGEQEVKPREAMAVMLVTSRTDGDFVTEVTHAKTEEFTIEKL